MEIFRRAKAKTPKFFKKVRNIGIVLTAVGTAIIGAPVVLPAAIVSIAGYLVVGGGVAAGIAQLTEDK